MFIFKYILQKANILADETNNAQQTVLYALIRSGQQAIELLVK